MMAFFDELFLQSSHSKLSNSSMEQWKISFENHVLCAGVSDPLGLHLSLNVFKLCLECILFCVWSCCGPLNEASSCYF